MLDDTSLQISAGQSPLSSTPELSTKSKLLCSVCQSVVSWIKSPDRQEQDSELFQFQPSFKALKASATVCPLCQFVLEDVFNGKIMYGNPEDEDLLVYTLWVSGEMDLQRGMFKLNWYEQLKFPSGYVGNPGDYYISNRHDAHLNSQALATTSLEIRSRLQAVSNWVSECRSCHTRCNEKLNILPGRLLDLASVDSQQKIILIESNTLEEQSIRYATLSHCWGPPTSKPPLRTIKSNYSEHSKGIALSSLTLNFHDAVLICCYLQIRYIWIDSLCIIQDSREDWEIEAAKMADIYRGSYLNIAAAAANDAHGGFIGQSSLGDLQKRFKTVYYRSRFTANAGTNSSNETLIVQKAIDTHVSHFFSDDAYPYFGRGWVLQELTLSPRTVIFPRGQMFWQCRHRFGSEDNTLWTDTFRILASGAANVSIFDFASPLNALKTWNLWVASYSRRRLTYASDVAAAIAGLVRFFSNSTKSTPVLGLWKESLAVGLGWRLLYRLEDKPPPQSRRNPEFPSWSWLSALPQIDMEASMYLPIQPDGCTLSLGVELWEENWAGAPYTSKLESSKLVISSFVRKAILTTPKKQRATTETLKPSGNTQSPIKPFGEPSWAGGCDIEYLLPAGSDLEVTIVQISQQMIRLNSSDPGTIKDEFLVLQKASGGDNRYHRLGVGDVQTKVDKGFESGVFHQVHFKKSDRDSIELA